MSGRAGLLCSAVGALVLAAVLAPVPAQAQQPPPQSQQRDYVVSLASQADPETTSQALVGQHGGQRRGQAWRTGVRAFAVRATASQAKALGRDARVAAVEIDGVVTAAAAQVLDAGADRVSRPDEVGVTSSGQAVDGVRDLGVDADVAVLDTGIDPDHPDLEVVGRADCQTSTCVDAAGIDDNGHGTHVAGIAAARDDRTGTVGVAPGARLWSVKVLNSYGSGQLSGVLAGMDWVAQRASTIDVVNMSVVYSESPALSAALVRLHSLGVTVVGAAGNRNVDAHRTFPAAHPTVLGVSAMADFDGTSGGLGSPTCRPERDDASAGFSNYGEVVDLTAPGVCVRSSAPGGGTTLMSGTSMAAPHVAGAAALLTSRPDHRGNPDAVRATLLATGSQAWTDLSPDGVQEPLLVVDTFEPVLVPDAGPPQIVVEDVRAVEPPVGATATVPVAVRVTPAPREGQSVSVVLATTSGSAVAGKDHLALPATRLTFLPGQDRLSVPVTVLGDAESEGTETIGLALSKPLGGVIADATGGVTLAEAASVARQQVSVDDVTVTEPEPGTQGSAVFTVRLSQPVPAGQVVSVVAATKDGTATLSLDYTRLLATTLTFAPGTTTRTVAVPVLADSVSESDEAFVLALSSAKGAEIADATATATVLDRQGPLQLTVSDAWSPEGTGSEQSATFTVALSSPPAAGQLVQVTVATSSGTAKSGTDFVAVPATKLVFAAGQTQREVAVRLVRDATGENDETFTLRLSSAVGAVLADASGTGTVADDDRDLPRPAPRTVSLTDLTLLEPAPGASATVTVQVRLDAPASDTATVLLQTTDGTARAGSDYDAVAPTVLVFAPGEQVQQRDLVLHGTDATDGLRTLQLRLSAPSAGLVLADDLATVAVRDPRGSLGASVANVRLAEGDESSSTATVEVRLSTPPVAGQQVSVRVATAAGTAAAGSDFTALAPTTVVFGPGEQSRTVELAVLGDLRLEGDEAFTVALSAPVGATLQDTAATVTLVDEEGPLLLTVADVRVLEGETDTTLRFALTLSAPPAPGQAPALTVATGTSTATAGADYVARPAARVSFTEGQQVAVVEVVVRGDTTAELDETVALVLSAPAGLSLTDTLGVGRILTDETP